ncbi:ribonuclease III [Microcoleus sp. Pol14C2]|uniref:ribonuclease III n=2 Tax=unclassified Microcoleus TaxID=2642155 RepID=UPI002FD5A96E
MAMNNNERVGNALKFLCQRLYPYVEQQMQAFYGERWLAKAQDCLVNNKIPKKKIIDNILREDVLTLLSVMSKQWDNVFKKHLTPFENALVIELIEVRNNWAHNSSFSSEDTYRALGSIAKLLKAIAASDADIKELEKQKQDVMRLLAQEQTRHETRSSSAEESRFRASLAELLETLNFQDASLLNQALTHRSYLYENPKEVSEDNELLEFLGDALLTFLSAEYLYRDYSNKSEGELTCIRSALVDKAQLAKFAIGLDIGKWMRLSKGEATNGGTAKESLLSNTFEAIIGAYFLDSGIEAVRDFVEPQFTSVVEEVISSQPEPDSNIFVDPKNQLQECVHQNIGPITPQYITIQEAGPDHAKEFTVEVRINGQVYGQGSGRSKKEAEKRAAEVALKKVRLI